METIGVGEARRRLSELLNRTARGESFRITKQGRPVARIVPAGAVSDKAAIARAVATLRSFRGEFTGMSRGEMLALRHDGHRW